MLPRSRWLPAVVRVQKRTVQDTQSVSDNVQHEELRVEREGDVNVTDESDATIRRPYLTRESDPQETSSVTLSGSRQSPPSLVGFTGYAEKLGLPMSQGRKLYEGERQPHTHPLFSYCRKSYITHSIRTNIAGNQQIRC